MLMDHIVVIELKVYKIYAEGAFHILDIGGIYFPPCEGSAVVSLQSSTHNR
jgi:hypothetical protein